MQIQPQDETFIEARGPAWMYEPDFRKSLQMWREWQAAFVNEATARPETDTPPVEAAP